MTDTPDNYSPPGGVTRIFRFAVEVELDPQAYLEQTAVGPRDIGVQASLAAEIQSNLESLPGILTARVAPG